MNVREITLDEWREVLPATGFEPFHAPEALTILDEYAVGDLRLFGGYRGEEPVGLFPVFVRDQWGFRFVVSPPPSLSVPRLGPVLLPTSPKRRKQSKLNQRFTEAVLDAVDADSFRTPFGMVGSSRYTDPRPYRWAGFDVSPRFSYVLDLEERDESDVLGSFSGSLRREIRKRDELDLTIDTAGADRAESICAKMKERHAEQGLTYPTPEPYAGDIVDALGDRSRVYVARGPDGDVLSGITVLYSNDVARFWQGGAKASYGSVSVNSLLHWTIIEDVLTDSKLDGIERYDLGSANARRVARYKSQFNADLRPNYEVTSRLMALAKKAYSLRRHLA